MQKKFEIRFDKTIFDDILKITPPKAGKLADGGGWKKSKKVWNKIWQISKLWYIKPYAAKRWQANGEVEIKKFEKSSKQNLTNLKLVLN